MAYDEALAATVRDLVGPGSGIGEREMFGGIAFMVDGNMAVGATGGDLMVRVGKEGHEDAVSLPGARAFEMGGKGPMVGWIRVSEEGFASETELAEWVDRGVGYARSLPPK
jgi:TfoX/Sxy family transcriptional regulator of competence genes